MSQRFVWKAVDANGIIQHGMWVGNMISEIQVRLRNEGYFPVSIRIRKNWLGEFLWSRPNEQWGHFAYRLAVLLEAGIPLLQALELMTFHEEVLTTELEQWKIVKGQVEAGKDLSEALLLLNPAPSSFVLSMIKAGECTGTLGKVLSEVAEELAQEIIYRKKVKAALYYPVFLFIAVLLVLFVLSTWVLPIYGTLFTSMNAELPFLTRVIFVCGRKLPYLLWSSLGLISGGLLFLKLSSPELWKVRLERIFGHLPFLRKIYRLRDLVQFSRILQRLLTAGTLRSREMLELTNQLVLNVRQGKRMAPLLRTSRVFPREGAEMIAVAEETGQLDRMLHYVLQMYRHELDDQLKQLTRMIGPALTLVLSVLIGLVAGAVMLPIFDLSSHLE